MVHSLLYVRPLDVVFHGHGSWPSGRILGFFHIYLVVLGGLGIILLDHGT